MMCLLLLTASNSSDRSSLGTLEATKALGRHGSQGFISQENRAPAGISQPNKTCCLKTALPYLTANTGSFLHPVYWARTMHAHLASTSQRAAALRRLTLCGWLFQQTSRSFLHLCSLKSFFPSFPLCLLQCLEFHPIPHTPTVLDSSLAQHLLPKFIQIISNHLY